jgi:hypothetical protein
MYELKLILKMVDIYCIMLKNNLKEIYMKKIKNFLNILIYVVIGCIAIYVIKVALSLDFTKPIENNNVTHIIKEETLEDGRNNNKKEPSADFQKYVDGIVLKNIVNYTTSYENIELFQNDELFRNAYTKATVFTFISENGENLISHLSKIELYNSTNTLTPVYKCFEVEDNNVLIIAIVDNDKLDLLNNEDKLKIKIECVDEDKNYYTSEKEFIKSTLQFNKEIFAGNIFNYKKDAYGIRINNSENTTAMLKEDLMANTMRYDFSNSFEIFTFGIDSKIDINELKLEYELNESLDDFDDIKIYVSAYKLYSNNIEEYNGEKELLCNLKIKIDCSINDTSITEKEIDMYKEIINNATISYNNIKMPLKQIIVEENMEIIQK